MKKFKLIIALFCAVFGLTVNGGDLLAPTESEDTQRETGSTAPVEYLHVLHGMWGSSTIPTHYKISTFTPNPETGTVGQTGTLQLNYSQGETYMPTMGAFGFRVAGDLIYVLGYTSTYQNFLEVYRIGFNGVPSLAAPRFLFPLGEHVRIMDVFKQYPWVAVSSTVSSTASVVRIYALQGTSIIKKSELAVGAQWDLTGCLASQETKLYTIKPNTSTATSAVAAYNVSSTGVLMLINKVNTTLAGTFTALACGKIKNELWVANNHTSQTQFRVALGSDGSIVPSGSLIKNSSNQYTDVFVSYWAGANQILLSGTENVQHVFFTGYGSTPSGILEVGAFDGLTELPLYQWDFAFYGNNGRPSCATEVIDAQSSAVYTFGLADYQGVRKYGVVGHPINPDTEMLGAGQVFPLSQSSGICLGVSQVSAR